MTDSPTNQSTDGPTGSYGSFASNYWKSRIYLCSFKQYHPESFFFSSLFHSGILRGSIVMCIYFMIIFAKKWRAEEQTSACIKVDLFCIPTYLNDMMNYAWERERGFAALRSIATMLRCYMAILLQCYNATLLNDKLSLSVRARD